jgi:transcriptional regulator with XRE-family HTH domain
VAQRRIAAITDQSQSEVSEIIAGRRVVVSYDVLVRISDGLGVPRIRQNADPGAKGSNY